MQEDLLVKTMCESGNFLDTQDYKVQLMGHVMWIIEYIAHTGRVLSIFEKEDKTWNK